MNILFYLIPLSILFGFIGVCAFIWAVKTGQYDDLKSESLKILEEKDLQNNHGENQ